ncbi:MAG: hypothetical protein ACOCYW_01160 [Roseicyclus sp.]
MTSALVPLLPAPGPAASADVPHRLARAPAFMTILEGNAPETGLARRTPSSFGGPLPVSVQRRECGAFGATLDFPAGIGVQTSQGMQPTIGCCRETP